MGIPLWLRRMAPVAFAAFIFWLSSQSMPVLFGPMSLNDKLKHMALYGTFTWLVYEALLPSIRRPAVLFWVTVGIVSLYGVTDEVHQYFVPGRSADVLDWVADTAAALIVCGALRSFRRRAVEGR